MSLYYDLPATNHVDTGRQTEASGITVPTYRHTPAVGRIDLAIGKRITGSSAKEAVRGNSGNAVSSLLRDIDARFCRRKSGFQFEETAERFQNTVLSQLDELARSFLIAISGQIRRGVDDIIVVVAGHGEAIRNNARALRRHKHDVLNSTENDSVFLQTYNVRLVR